MAKNVATHIVFQRIRTGEEITVPLADAAQYQQDNGGHVSMLKVVWDDGSWSWGKLWWFGGTNIVCRIGAGAYGDLVVWEHPVSPYDSKARRAAGIDAA